MVGTAFISVLWAKSASFCLFWSFSHHNSIINWKSVDVVHWNWTWSHRMVGTDWSTELWRPPFYNSVTFQYFSTKISAIFIDRNWWRNLPQTFCCFPKGPKTIITYVRISHSYFDDGFFLDFTHLIQIWTNFVILASFKVCGNFS